MSLFFSTSVSGGGSGKLFFEIGNQTGNKSLNHYAVRSQNNPRVATVL